jgi:hypothetical protein
MRRDESKYLESPLVRLRRDKCEIVKANINVLVYSLKLEDEYMYKFWSDKTVRYYH